MIDVVLPKGNEKEFLKLAKKLGYKELIFLYDKPVENDYKKAILVKNSNEVSKYKGKFDYIFAVGKPWAFQDKRVDLVFGMESLNTKDYMHHKGSGMNQVMAKQAKENKTKIAFSVNQLLGDDVDVVIGRMRQNAVLSKKYKNEVVFASFATKPLEMRSPKDVQALARILGFHATQAKQALNSL